jgi:TPR repeat protein
MQASAAQLPQPGAASDAGPGPRLEAPYEQNAPTGPSEDRFGVRPSDEAFSAYQRGFYKTALNLARPLAEKGDAASQVLVAEILSRGLGVARDEKEAAKWYMAAADQGMPEAEFQAALLLLDGRFFAKDIERATGLMEKAAEAGNRMAMFNTGQLRLQLEPGPTGLAQARPWFQKAAEGGLADAQYALSQLILAAPAVSLDEEKEAVAWLRAAATQNFDTAQLDLATMLIQGKGTEERQKEGFFWMLRAARQGNVAAQNRTAKLYRAGIGVDADPVEAAAWYTLARRAGLADHDMDIFLDGLTDEERRDALTRANRLR